MRIFLSLKTLLPAIWAWALRFTFLIGICHYSSVALALDCDDVKVLTRMYTQAHFSHPKFTKSLAEQTLEKMIKQWDSAKIYFYQQDVDRFRKQYGQSLHKLISSSDCTFIQDIADTFFKRFGETSSFIEELIHYEHDFSISETIMLRADNIEPAITPAELKERWRKRVKYQYLQLLDEHSMSEARKILKKRYEMAAKSFHNTSLADIYSDFLKAFASALDPHSDYFSPADLENYQIRMRLSLEGIGVSIKSDNGFVYIVKVISGGAADKQGELKPGDKIIAVAQGESEFEDVIDLELDTVVQMIRGKRGTLVRLRVLRTEGSGSYQMVVSIVREKIDLKESSVQSFTYDIQSLLPSKTLKLGVVVVPLFYSELLGSKKKKKDKHRSVSEDVESEVKKLLKQDVEAIVIDLRNNGGGALDEAIKMCGLFIPDAPVVQIKNKKIEQSNARDGKLIYNGPLVVLVDMLSASASEIFAGAMKDHGRGVVVGSHQTFGKGTVQRHIPLGGKKGAINVTTSKFFTPSGMSTQKLGVASHIVFPSLFEQYEIGEKFRENPLEWEKIPSAKLLELPHLNDDLLSRLVQRSTKRQSADADFVSVLREIERFKANKKEGTPVSLKVRTPLIQETSKSDTSAPLNISTSPDESEMPNLWRDFNLREALYIAADYAALSQNLSLPLGYQLSLHPSPLDDASFSFQSGCEFQHGASLFGC